MQLVLCNIYYVQAVVMAWGSYAAAFTYSFKLFAPRAILTFTAYNIEGHVWLTVQILHLVDY